MDLGWKSVDGGGSKPLIIALYGGYLRAAVDFYRLIPTTVQ